MSSQAEEHEDPAVEAALYALLGRLLAAEVDAEFLAVLRSPGVAEVFERAVPACLVEFDLEDAAAEYCRLFVLPGGVPAVAGAWLPGEEPNRAAGIAGLVANLKSELQLELPQDLPPDHAGLLLPLLAWLTGHQADAADDFIDAALRPWLASFARALAGRSNLPLYRAVGKLLIVCVNDW